MHTHPEVPDIQDFIIRFVHKYYTKNEDTNIMFINILMLSNDGWRLAMPKDTHLLERLRYSLVELDDDIYFIVSRSLVKIYPHRNMHAHPVMLYHLI